MTRSILLDSGAPLSGQCQAQLRAMLLEQRAFRVEQLTQLKESHGPLGSTNREISSTLAAGARAALHEVQKALWRMDEGRYGLCVTCGDTVGRERLEILPAAALCLLCQRRAAGAA